MKKLLPIFLFCTFYLTSAQQIIFNQEISPETLSTQQKITPELAANYVKTKYYQQSSFDLKSSMEIHLPDSRVITVNFKNVFTYSNRTKSYVYQIVNEPNSDLVFSKFEDTVTGMYIGSNGEKISFHQTTPSIFAVSIVNQGMLDNQEKKDDFLISEGNSGNKSALANNDVCSDLTPICPPTVIDVMILYTADAKNIWGGTAASNTYAATAVTNFNTSLVNSGVNNNTTINLVYSGEIAYTESGNISTDLSRLRNPTDGFMDDAHTLRATYGADLVSLVTSTPTNICGLGYLNTNPTNYSNSSAFTVCLYNCAVSNLTIAHEMGHNMGLNHDWYVSQSTSPCSHHKGYINQTAITLGTSSPSNKRWRTIMAYTDQCSSVGIGCPKINRWSNPDLSYNGDPTGVPITSPQPAHETYGFLRFGCVVATFMPTMLMGVNDEVVETDNLTVSPSPASENVYIKTKMNKKLTYRILNSVGQQVLVTTENTFSVQDWTPGVYIVNAYDKNTLTGSKKFMVK